MSSEHYWWVAVACAFWVGFFLAKAIEKRRIEKTVKAINAMSEQCREALKESGNVT